MLNLKRWFVIIVCSSLIFHLSCNDDPTSPNNTAPTASFTINPSSGSKSTTFQFDAAGSSDNEDQTSTLQVRWDWENDGSWDTEYSTTKTAAHQFTAEGTYTVKLEIKDNGGLTAETTKNVTVSGGSSVEIEWAFVPKGSFTWGENNESKSIDYDYYVSKYEITNAQYMTYLEEALAAGDITATGAMVKGYYEGDERWSAGTYVFMRLESADCRIDYRGGSFSIISGYENHPVVEVSWFGCYAFARHCGWTLPTEEEWEKAARGNTGYDFPWGNDIDGSMANYYNSGDPYEQGAWAEYPQTTPIGYYDNTSPCGAYDMAGNVWEYTFSFHLQSSASQHYRLALGGGWTSSTYHLKPWGRYYCGIPGSYDLGFRVSRAF